MKKKKIFGVFAVVTIAALSLASCDKNDNGNNTPEDIKYRFDEAVDTRGNLDIDMDGAVTNDMVLTSISADVTNVKTHYYVGDEFDASGLIVKANYVKHVDNSIVSETKVVDGYYYSIENIDLSRIGTYFVDITYREGATITTTKYGIYVTNSELDDFDVEYLAGIEPTPIIEVSKNSTLKIGKDVFKMHYFKNAVETRVEDMDDTAYANLVLNVSKVNMKSSGSYVVPYSYETSVLDKNDVKHDYTLTGFIVVRVK